MKTTNPLNFINNVAMLIAVGAFTALVGISTGAMAQVNCNNFTGSQRTYCLQRQIQIYQEQSRFQNEIVRDLNRGEERANRFMQYTPSWSRGTWNAVRRGYYWRRGR